MKKDRLLERKFDEYRGGVAASGTATSRAKAIMESEERTTKRYPRKSVVFAFCSVLITVVAIVSIGLYIGSKPTPDSAPDVDNNNALVNDSSFSPPATNSYTDAVIHATPVSIYGKLPTAVSFLKNYEYADNAAITALTSYSVGGKTVLYKASLVDHVNGRLTEAEIYAEFSSETYEPLLDFHNGEDAIYKNLTYRTYESEDNGEPVRNILIIDNGIKYYFSVTSSDTEAYKRYLDIFTK